MKLEQAIILAGGKGTTFYMWYRSPAQLETPKAMLNINGKPLLEHIIRSLRSGGISDITLAVHHGKDLIKKYFKDGSELGVRLRYLEDGGAGHVRALRLFEPYADDAFVTCYGDHYFSDEFAKKRILTHEHKGVSVSYYKPTHLWPNAVMEVDEQGKIRTIAPWNLGECGPFRETEHGFRRHEWFLKYGEPVSKTAHVFSNRVFDLDLDKDFISSVLGELSQKNLAYAVRHNEMEIHIHNMFSYVFALGLLDRSSYERFISGIRPDIAWNIGNDLQVEIEGKGRYSWEL